MISLDRIKSFFDLRQSVFNLDLREKLSAATHLFLGTEDDNAKNFRLAFQSLVYPILCRDGYLPEKNKMIYHRLLEEYFNLHIAELYSNELVMFSPLLREEAIEIILHTKNTDPIQTAEFLIVLNCALTPSEEQNAELRKISAALGMNSDRFDHFFCQAMENEQKKQRLKNSSRSIIATLIILLIFFLTAKYLQSVIFGVLLACILLPLEKFVEKRLRQRNGIIFLINRFITGMFYPLRKLSDLLSRQADSPVKKVARQRQKQQQAIIRQSVIITVIISGVLAIMAAWGISKLTGHYMKDVQRSIRLWASQQPAAHNASPSAEKNSKYTYVLESLRENFESIPLVQHGLDYLEKVINDPAKKEQIIRNLLRNSGGILNITGGVVGGIIGFFCDILLTIFFAMLFLLKFAEYTGSNQKRRASGSEYIVRNFFNGIWLPGADDSLISETCKLINGIIFRLRVWLKGYLTLILVDSSVYTTCFFFLGVPFFLPLGLIAGCGIALPYLGPIISCLLTILVTIASGAASGEMLLAIIICYLIYNGIVEQFILYPAVIGESLGLSTLETIIIVLLGAVFAGIPGMIFALPTASVAKYIIPQIYHGFSLSRN